MNRTHISRLMLAPALLAICLSSTPLWADMPSIGPVLPTTDKAPDVAPADAAKPPTSASDKSQDSKADAAKEPGAATSDKQIEATREKVAEEIRVAQRKLDAATASGDEASQPTKALSRRPELLKKRDSLLAQRQALAARQSDQLKSLSSARKRAEKPADDLPEKGPPYSFMLLEQLRDSLNTATARAEMNQAAVDAAHDALKDARENLAEKDARRVLAKDAVRKNKDAATAEKLQEDLELAELEADVAREELQLREAELAVEKMAVETNDVRRKSTRAKLAAIEHQVEFTRDELQERLTALETSEAELKHSLETLAPGSVAVRLAEQQWMEARGRLEAMPERPPALTEEVTALRRARQTQQQQVAATNRQLHRIGALRECWNRRFAVFNEQNSRDDLEKWHEETKQALSQLEREAKLEAVRIDQLRKEQAALEEKARRPDRRDQEVVRWIDQQRRELTQLLTVLDADRIQLEAARRQHDTLLAEIGEKIDTRTLSDYGQDAWRRVRSGWNFVITTAGTNENPITVGKVISAVLLVFAGYLLARWISRLVVGRLPRRFGVTQNAASALETISFYTLVAMFTVMALYYVDVPLTAFTIAGGAVALGVGFGSQNIMNNFISGLILLAEQPIRVGDQIQVEGMSAKVEHIGARSTRVRTPSNQEIIVPNSSFLQNNVINWTLSDNNVRGEIKLGVAYGSDLEETRKTLIAAAKEHELVMAQPAPFVWLMDFGDNAVQFELHFWIQMASSSQRRQIESDVRFIIDRRFREKNLVMAYPQREVHLNTAHPLAVQLLGPPDAGHRLADSRAAA